MYVCIYIYIYIHIHVYIYIYIYSCVYAVNLRIAGEGHVQAMVCIWGRGGGLGSRPKKMYGERLGDGVEYHLMSPTPRC